MRLLIRAFLLVICNFVEHACREDKIKKQNLWNSIHFLFFKFDDDSCFLVEESKIYTQLTMQRNKKTCVFDQFPPQHDPKLFPQLVGLLTPIFILFGFTAGFSLVFLSISTFMDFAIFKKLS